MIKKRFKDVTALNPRQRTYIIVISILLHILFIFLWEAAVKLNLITAEVRVKPDEAIQPIVFDLQPPPQERPRQVIETPEDAKTVEKQTRANFLSDKNALARNQEQAPKDLKIGEGFSRGDLKSQELPTRQGPRGETPKPLQQEKPQQEQKPGKESQKKPEIKPEDTSIANITRQWDERQKKLLEEKQIKPPGVQDQLPRVLHDNPDSRSLDSGGLSFNTYNWDFAPYMLMLKRRIGRNIFPPVAFTHLGIISGETLVRFKIYPNGLMKDLEILGYTGHKTLMETSWNAVKLSAPFPELPADFSEPYLEVTGKFIYFVRR